MLDKRANLVETLFCSWHGTDFEWGMRDCICLGASVLWAFGNKVNFKTGMYHNEIGAIRAIKKAGYVDLVDAVNSQPVLEKIGPSFAIIGDLIGINLPDKPGWAAITVYMGNGRVLGFYDNGLGLNKCTVMQPKFMNECLAWRVPCHQQSV